jgi:predicted secreted hydrolase
MSDQEMNVSYAYWEGAVNVKGEFANQLVAGSGYVEMTGYAASMEGEF